MFYCCDLHSHSSYSDGVLSPEELVHKAYAAGVRVLAISDHDYITPLAELQSQYPDMVLLHSAEVSCLWKERVIHILGLNVDPCCTRLQNALKKNRNYDRRPYIQEMLDKLRQYHIDLGSYDDVAAACPGIEHIGRMHIAREIWRRGYAESPTQALDLYVGSLGQKLCYVPTPAPYVTTEEAIAAIREANGLPVLAHPFYYRLSDAQLKELIQGFASLSGPGSAGLEVFYNDYSQKQVLKLMCWGREYNLLFSAGSDYHGNAEQRFSRVPIAACAPLLEQLGILIRKRAVERRDSQFYSIDQVYTELLSPFNEDEIQAMLTFEKEDKKHA